MYLHTIDLTEIFNQYEIPINRNTVTAIHNIQYWLKDIINLDELIPYLKNRAQKDLYNTPPNKKEYQKEYTKNWEFYLECYGEYVEKVLSKLPHWERKQYLYPKDIYHTIYCLREEAYMNYIKKEILKEETL